LAEEAQEVGSRPGRASTPGGPGAGCPLSRIRALGTQTPVGHLPGSPAQASGLLLASVGWGTLTPHPKQGFSALALLALEAG